MSGAVLALVARGWMSPETGAEWMSAVQQIGPLDYAIAALAGVTFALVGVA